MFSIILKVVSYIFSGLIALASIVFFVMTFFLFANPSPLYELALSLQIPLILVDLIPWIIILLGIFILGPITLMCVNFFQQSRIIKLLSTQNDQLLLARLDHSFDDEKPL